LCRIGHFPAPDTGDGRRSATSLALACAPQNAKDAHVQHEHHGPGRKWRRFIRKNRAAMFALSFLLLILAAVALLFWLMSDMRFVTR
jgi:hypothetical protein